MSTSKSKTTRVLPHRHVPPNFQPAASSFFSSVEQEHLIIAYHSTRLSLQLSHNDAIRSSTFWHRIHIAMSLRGCHKPLNTWRCNWLRMRTRLLVRIEKARRRRRSNSAWLTLLNYQMLAVVLDTVDQPRLEYLDKCMADDVHDEDDRYELCATVYRDMSQSAAGGGDVFMMRCQHCRQTFAEAADLLQHVRQYCAAGKTDEFNESNATAEMMEPEPPQLPDHFASSNDDDGPLLTTAAAARAAMPVERQPDEIDLNMDPIEYGFVTDSDDEIVDDVDDTQFGDKPSRKTHYLHIPCTFAACPARFGNNKQRVAHSLLAHGKRPFVCAQCPASLDSQKLLDRHVEGHLMRFECDICKRRFPSHPSIVRHMHTHSAQPITCQDCGIPLKSATLLKEHWRRMHANNVKRLVCEHCGKSFHDMTGLKSHKLIHMDNAERPTHRCDLCGATFRQKHYVSIHVQRVHTKSRPFQCRHAGCTETYRQTDSRLNHEKRVHGRSGAPWLNKQILQEAVQSIQADPKSEVIIP